MRTLTMTVAMVMVLMLTTNGFAALGDILFEDGIESGLGRWTTAGQVVVTSNASYVHSGQQAMYCVNQGSGQGTANALASWTATDHQKISVWTRAQQRRPKVGVLRIGLDGQLADANDYTYAFTAVTEWTGFGAVLSYLDANGWQPTTFPTTSWGSRDLNIQVVTHLPTNTFDVYAAYEGDALTTLVEGAAAAASIAQVDGISLSNQHVDTDSAFDEIVVTEAIPEPTTIALVAIGAVGLIRRRK